MFSIVTYNCFDLCDKPTLAIQNDYLQETDFVPMVGVVAPMAPSIQRTKSGAGYSQDQLDVAQVIEVAWWARDMAQWDAMRAAYHPGAMVDISWFNGPATEFVSRAKQIYELGGRSLHLHGPVLVNAHGDRATADLGAQIFVAGNINGSHLLLFDLRADPSEKHDLAAQHPDLVVKLKTLLEAWERDVDQKPQATQ